MTRPYRVHTMPTRRRAVGRVAAGESITAVAVDMDLPRALLSRWCSQDGVSSAHPSFTDPVYVASLRNRYTTPDVRAQAVAAVRNGASYGAAARLVGVSRPAVRLWVLAAELAELKAA